MSGKDVQPDQEGQPDPDGQSDQGGGSARGRGLSSSDLEGYQPSQEANPLEEALAEYSRDNDRSKANLSRLVSATLSRGVFNMNEANSQVSIPGPARILASRLATLLEAQSHRRWQRGLRRGRFDARSAYKLFTSPTHDVFKKRGQEQANGQVAITILADMSGSMEGDRIRVQREALAAIAMALNGIPDVRYAIRGYRDTSYLYGFREFDDSLNKTLRKLVNMSAGGGTCLVPPMIYCWTELMRQPNVDRRILLVTICNRNA